MKVSMNWLKEYVDIDNNYKLLEDKFNLMSQEVESLYKLVDIEGLVVGKVLSCEKLPDSDHLNLTSVNVGEEVLQIICGAPNVAKDQHVIVAKVGTTLPGNFKIKRAKIRGVESVGMICSLEELGIKDFDAAETGIYVLGDDSVIGSDPLEYLHLDDYVLDLDLTANRADLLSMEGVAYDVASMIDTDIRLKEHKYAIRKTENNVKVFTETKDCSAYYAQVIDNIKIKPSPAWLKARLMAAGVRPISNVVDITNYVLMEYGQPLHAFDLDKVKSETIIVRHAKEGETLVTLDDQKRDLLKSDLVITDGEKTIALAGVMGGLETEIDDSSNRILLEAACFDPVHIRKTSKRLDLKSEASTRFEKGVDPNKVKKAMDFATQLFIELADGEVVGEYTFFDNNDKDPLDIELTLAKLNHVTGKVFSIDEVKDILRRLRFKYHLKDDKFTITVPTRRQSFYSYQDVIEEIVRIYGYDKIPVAIPKTPTSGYLSVTQKLRRLVRNYFVNIGFNETVTYSLVSAGQAVEFDKTQIPVVEVMNPLNKEKSCLRHSLLPSLIDILQYNKARKINDVMLFELGRKYESGKETELLSGLMNGIYAANLWQGKKEAVDFYQLKGIIETLLNRLNIEDYQIIKTENPLEPMHPGICADVLISGEYIGFFGKLHPQREYDLGISKTFLFEFDFEKIAQAYKLDLIMDSIPKYPSVTRDLALLVDKSVSAAVILEKIREANKKSLVDVEIFDIYSGENIEEGKLSIALSLTFQNPDKTLEAKDVDTSIERILKHLEKSLGAKLR